MMNLLRIERNDLGVYFVEYCATMGVERFKSPLEVREFLRKIPNNGWEQMASNRPVFSGFENHREVENSFRVIYNVRVREALSASSPNQTRTKVLENYEYHLSNA